MFNRLFEITWLNSLLQLSLALGLIGFILNLAPAIARKISSSERRSGSSKGGG